MRRIIVLIIVIAAIPILMILWPIIFQAEPLLDLESTSPDGRFAIQMRESAKALPASSGAGQVYEGDMNL